MIINEYNVRYKGDGFLMKYRVIAIGGLLSLPMIMHSCLNTISNNTALTFKVAEVKNENADLKKQVYLPDEYLENEEKAHTLLPHEEVAFGGHYVPTFIIYKEYEQNNLKKWRPLMIVKQLRCGPRGPENKYLLMTDLLQQTLPNDYQDVYKFTPMVEPSELKVLSTNEKELTKVANPYQEFSNILDDARQKLQELWSRTLQVCPNVRIEPSKENDGQQEQHSKNTEHAEKCPSCGV